MKQPTANQLFIGIGVHAPKGMPPLPGVMNSIQGMETWALQQGYATKVITDETQPVTQIRLRNELEDLLSSHDHLHRIVFYFVGHGFLDPPDQIWILSDGPGVNIGRLSRNTLRASIATYRPEQISMISDACLEARNFASGAISVINDRPGPRRRVFVDNFYSTLPNDPSFFFRGEGDSEDFCLFTSVLLDFLNGKDERAFRLSNGLSEAVTTQTLYLNLPDAVLDRGAILNVDQEPRIEPGFPQGDDVYTLFTERVSVEPTLSGSSSDGGSTTTTDPVPDSPSATNRHDARPLSQRIVASDFDLPPLLDPEHLDRLREKTRSYDQELVALVHHSGPNASWGFIVNERPTGFFTSPIPDEKGDGWWYPILRSDLDESIPYVGRRPRSFLTLSWSTKADPYDHLFTMLPVFDQLMATVHLRNSTDTYNTGCIHLSWTPNYSSYSYTKKTQTAWWALDALASGRLQGKDAIPIADSMRDEKHANPMIGIVCAYLYDLVGDTDSISRLCHFYVKHNQCIPFDIAILAGGEIRQTDDGCDLLYSASKKDKLRSCQNIPSYLWRSTPEGKGRIAGAAPLFRSGWNRLCTQKHGFLRKLSTLSEHLTKAPIATIAGKHARARTVDILRVLRLL